VSASSGPEAQTEARAPELRSLSLLPLGEKALVMDRANGKWVMVAADAAPLVRLLPFEEAAVPPDLRPRRAEMLRALAAAGLGSAPYVPRRVFNALILKLTTACNFRCAYCYSTEPHGALSHMPLEIALRSMEEALKRETEAPPNAGRPDLLVILHGGEPGLVFPLIRRLVLEGERMAERAGKRIAFGGQTNLSPLSQEMVNFSLAHHIAWGVSLDGPPEWNDTFRVLADGGGTYRYFEKARSEYPEFIRSCGILTTVTSANQDHLLAIARHFRDCGAAGWGWTLFQAAGLGREQAGRFAISYERLIAAWDELFAAVEAGEFQGFEVGPVVRYLENLVCGPGSNMCMRQGCGAARELLSVSADGTIEACDCIDPQGPLAHLGRVDGTGDSLRRAADSDRARLVRSRDVTAGACGVCIWLPLCGGTCMAYAPSLHGRSEGHCAVARNAFTRVAQSLARSAALKRYWDSVFATHAAAAG
jgi:uncharacterized protein